MVCRWKNGSGNGSTFARKVVLGEGVASGAKVCRKRYVVVRRWKMPCCPRLARTTRLRLPKGRAERQVCF